MNEETIFAAALARPPEERAAYLAEACASNADLRKRLEGLLADSERTGNFMASPVVASAGSADSGTDIFVGASTPNNKEVTRDAPDAGAEDHSEADDPSMYEHAGVRPGPSARPVRCVS